MKETNVAESNAALMNNKKRIIIRQNILHQNNSPFISSQFNYNAACVSLFNIGHFPGTGTLTPLLSPLSESPPK